MTVSVDEFEVADTADSWTAAGFAVDPDAVCRIGGVRIRLVGRERGTGIVPSIDRMLESTAQAMGSQVIAVILTGMSGDGVAGVRAVHACGGRVLVEAPQSAIMASMPEAVIRSGCVHDIVPLRRMADAITRLTLSRPSLPTPR
mgnify:CR=1 FL=1